MKTAMSTTATTDSAIEWAKPRKGTKCAICGAYIGADEDIIRTTTAHQSNGVTVHSACVCKPRAIAKQKKTNNDVYIQLVLVLVAFTDITAGQLATLAVETGFGLEYNAETREIRAISPLYLNFHGLRDRLDNLLSVAQIAGVTFWANVPKEERGDALIILERVGAVYVPDEGEYLVFPSYNAEARKINDEAYYIRAIVGVVTEYARGELNLSDVVMRVDAIRGKQARGMNPWQKRGRA